MKRFSQPLLALLSLLPTCLLLAIAIGCSQLSTSPPQQRSFVGEWTGKFVEIDETIDEKIREIEAETGTKVNERDFDLLRSMASIMEFGLIMNRNGSGVFIDGGNDSHKFAWSLTEDGAVATFDESGESDKPPKTLYLSVIDETTIRGESDGSRFLFTRRE